MFTGSKTKFCYNATLSMFGVEESWGQELFVLLSARAVLGAGWLAVVFRMERCLRSDFQWFLRRKENVAL